MDKAGETVPCAVDLSGERICQISLAVEDAKQTAGRFSEIFGASWKFYELEPRDVVLRDTALGDAPCVLKAALAAIGGLSFKLIQPVAGESSYAEFLKRNGEGLYAVSFGTLANHDQVLEALREAGIAVEMQGDLGGGSRFTILETVGDLGCRIEFCSPARAEKTNLRQTGELRPRTAAVIDMDKPVFSGGRKFNQVGMVVADEKRAAKRFEELLGIRPWSLSMGPPGLSDALLDERPVPPSAMPSLDVAFANGRLGDIQIELIRPLGLRPGGCHQRFIDRHGNGIQHLSFGLQGDYHRIVDAMAASGIGREFATALKTPDAVYSVSYFATQGRLSGFQLEAVGVKSL